MRFLEIWINDDNNNMIEAKPVNIDYLLGREWELPQINKPIIKYPTKKTQMRTKNNTNQQKIPTHNRDNENCHIADKREYEVNLDKKYVLINFSCFRKT